MEAQPLGKGAGGGESTPIPQPSMPRAESWNLPLRTQLLLNECVKLGLSFLLHFPLSPSPHPLPLPPPPHTQGAWTMSPSA